LIAKEIMTRMPCMYLNHGGGPLPVLGRQPQVAELLKNIPSLLPATPSAILVVTAHWVEPTVSVSSGHSHQLLYDYGGFPPESYEYKYPAPGKPEIARTVTSLLEKENIPCRSDSKRGWDHGVFIPLMLMFPEAVIPVVSLSLHASLDPALHIRIGQALAPLRSQGVLIVGSGASFHNFGYFFARNDAQKSAGLSHGTTWNDYLVQTLTSSLTREERISRLTDWSSGPSALEAHPRGEEEHLIPLHVIAGVALADVDGTSAATLLPPAMPKGTIPMSSFMWL